MLAAYLIEPGPRRATRSTSSPPSTASRSMPDAAGRGGDGRARPRAPRRARRLAPLLRERLAERGTERLYREIELPLTAVLASMEDVGVKIDTYRMGEITARLADRVEELEARAHELAGEEFMLGSTQQVGADPVREARADARAARARPATRPTRACCARSAATTRSSRVIEEWREYSKLLNTYLEPLPSLISRGRRPAAHDVQPGGRLDRPALDVEPEPAGDPDPHRARARDPLGLRRRDRLPAALGRLLADRAAHPRARLRRAEAARGVRARRGHPHARRPPRCSARTRPR